jgi:protein gp37
MTARLNPAVTELAEVKESYTVPEWKALSSSEQQGILANVSLKTKLRFNAQKTGGIEWAKWSWNPITGCRNDCQYCYARDIAERFYKHGFEPAFLPARLAIPRSFRPPALAKEQIGLRNVFTCSMADLFGPWIPDAWIDAVLQEVQNAPQCNFLFLTKFPTRLVEQKWPDNAWVGTTIDTQKRVAAVEKAFRRVKAKVKWLSCEPLLERLDFTALDLFDWIVIGGQSRSKQLPGSQPAQEWVEHLVQQARQAGCKIYFKPNLLVWPRDMTTPLKEYPQA